VDVEITALIYTTIERDSIYDCATTVLTNPNVWAVTVTPRLSDDSKYDCHAFTQQQDYNAVIVKKTVGAMSCFLKGRNKCPNMTDPIEVEEVPGAWVRGMMPNVTSGSTTVAASSKCHQVAYAETGGNTLGYYTTKGSNGVVVCHGYSKYLGGIEVLPEALEEHGQFFCLYDGHYSL